jgi:hypothetical protein
MTPERQRRCPAQGVSFSGRRRGSRSAIRRGRRRWRPSREGFSADTPVSAASSVTTAKGPSRVCRTDARPKRARRDHARFRDRTRISLARLPAHMGALLCCGSGPPARRRPDRRRPRRIPAWQLRSRPADNLAAGAAWESRRVAPHVGLSDRASGSTTPSSIRERWMTSLLSIAHCPAGSIVLGEVVGGERGPKLVRILVGHFTAECTFRLRRKRLSGS